MVIPPEGEVGQLLGDDREKSPENPDEEDLGWPLARGGGFGEQPGQRGEEQEEGGQPERAELGKDPEIDIVNRGDGLDVGGQARVLDRLVGCRLRRVDLNQRRNEPAGTDA